MPNYVSAVAVCSLTMAVEKTIAGFHWNWRKLKIVIILKQVLEPGGAYLFTLISKMYGGLFLKEVDNNDAPPQKKLQLAMNQRMCELFPCVQIWRIYDVEKGPDFCISIQNRALKRFLQVPYFYLAITKFPLFLKTPMHLSRLTQYLCFMSVWNPLDLDQAFMTVGMGGVYVLMAFYDLSFLVTTSFF